MDYIGVWGFIAGVIVIGLGTGFWLQTKLENSHQNIKLPSAFEAE